MIALTRESSDNEKLENALEAAGCTHKIVHLPAIGFRELEFEVPPSDSFDCVCLTSPEGARRWTSNAFRVAAIGAATAKVINDRGKSEVAFVSDVSDAASFGTSLPSNLGPRVIIAGSKLQKPTLEETLRGRGFEVTVIHTYTTDGRSLEELTETERKMIQEVTCWTFASPSSVEAVNKWGVPKTKALCIGKTTGKAAQESGWDAHWPPNPGLAEWASLITLTEYCS